MSVDETKQKLLHQLQSPNPQTRHEATRRLWELWYGAAGYAAELLLLHAESLLERGEGEQAEARLSEVIERYPAFAEGWNRRATLRYMLKRYADSLADCLEVVRLEPYHFGAWHGMGLCLMALHRYGEAADAFRRALQVQPFAPANRELLLTCLAKLN